MMCVVANLVIQMRKSPKVGFYQSDKTFIPLKALHPGEQNQLLDV